FAAYECGQRLLAGPSGSTKSEESMNKYTIVKARTITLLIGVAAALAGANAALAQGTLTAAKVSAAPKPATQAADPAWAKAAPLTVKLSSGANFKDGATTVTLKAVYTTDMLYMLVQYDDPTQSVRRSPYVKQPD